MNYKKLFFSIILTLSVGLINLTAQTSVNTTGRDAFGNGGMASYSIGQVFYTTNPGTNNSEAQGVQQPYEISIVTGIEKKPNIDLLVSVFPNPTLDFLTLKVDTELNRSISYQLYNLNGKLMKSAKILGNETQINLSDYDKSTYFIKVIYDNQSIKDFKIVKR